jgi:hypothetical protein
MSMILGRLNYSLDVGLGNKLPKLAGKYER